jgi:hypothetical protein
LFAKFTLVRDTPKVDLVVALNGRSTKVLNKKVAS